MSFDVRDPVREWEVPVPYVMQLGRKYLSPNKSPTSFIKIVSKKKGYMAKANKCPKLSQSCYGRTFKVQKSVQGTIEFLLGPIQE